MSLIGGASTLLLLVKGTPIRTFLDARSDVINFLYHFIMPFFGGILLLLSGSTMLNLSSSMLHRDYTLHSRDKFARKRDRMLDVMLNVDEKRVLELVGDNSNGALQSDLVIKSGFSKVKMHRTLKKLENKDLIRRGRFGITNRVFLNRTNSS